MKKISYSIANTLSYAYDVATGQWTKPITNFSKKSTVLFLYRGRGRGSEVNFLHVLRYGDSENYLKNFI